MLLSFEIFFVVIFSLLKLVLIVPKKSETRLFSTILVLVVLILSSSSSDGGTNCVSVVAIAVVAIFGFGVGVGVGDCVGCVTGEGIAIELMLVSSCGSCGGSMVLVVVTLQFFDSGNIDVIVFCLQYTVSKTESSVQSDPTSNNSTLFSVRLSLPPSISLLLLLVRVDDDDNGDSIYDTLAHCKAIDARFIEGVRTRISFVLVHSVSFSSSLPSPFNCFWCSCLLLLSSSTLNIFSFSSFSSMFSFNDNVVPDAETTASLLFVVVTAAASADPIFLSFFLVHHRRNFLLENIVFLVLFPLLLFFLLLLLLILVLSR